MPSADQPGEGGLFITRFPNGEGRWQVAGAPVATRAVLLTAWSRLSKELFFLNPGNDRDTFELRAVSVSEDSGVGLAPSVLLFKVDAATAALGFDAAPDGKSFVLRRDAGRASGGPPLHPASRSSRTGSTNSQRVRSNSASTPGRR